MHYIHIIIFIKGR